MPITPRSVVIQRLTILERLREYALQTPGCADAVNSLDVLIEFQRNVLAASAILRDELRV